MNKVELIGRLTKAPDIRGECKQLTARFTLAVQRNYGEDADFIRCVAFGRLAEIIEKYLDKGKQIALIGHIQTGAYNNSNCERIYYTNVVAESVEFLDKAPKVITEYVEREPDGIKDGMPF